MVLFVFVLLNNHFKTATMKTQLFLFWVSLLGFQAFAQDPVIEGDTLLCPFGDGSATIVSPQIYDSYQWYYSFGPVWDPIFGENDPTFNYNAEFVGDAYIRVRVMLDGIYYYSNALFIETIVFDPITTTLDYDPATATVNPDGSVLLCNGATFTITLDEPYTASIQWYRNNSPISGADDVTYEVSVAGEYFAVAAPGECPVSLDFSPLTTVEINNRCELGLSKKEKTAFAMYPNPVKNQLNFTSAAPVENLKIYAMTGQTVLEAHPKTVSGNVDVQDLKPGMYMLSIDGRTVSRIIKE